MSECHFCQHISQVTSVFSKKRALSFLLPPPFMWSIMAPQCLMNYAARFTK